MIINEIYKMRVRTTAILLFLLLLMVLFLAFRDFAIASVARIPEDVEESMPKIFRKMLGSGLSELAERLKEDDFYLWSQWLGKNFGQFVPFVALIVSFPLFARERERKTLYFLLTRKTRKEVYVSKALSGALMLVFILISMTILPFLITKILGWDISLSKLPAYCLQVTAGGLTFYALFLLFSILSKDQVKPMILGIMVLVGDAFLGLLGKLKVLNLYPYIMGKSVFYEGKVQWNYTWGSIAAIAFFVVLGWMIFKNQDF